MHRAAGGTDVPVTVVIARHFVHQHPAAVRAENHEFTAWSYKQSGEPELWKGQSGEPSGAGKRDSFDSPDSELRQTIVPK
jgi:hypothetical protein